MKKNIFVTGILLLFYSLLYAQHDNYKVVFDLTSRDTMDHKAVIRWVGEIMKSNPDAMLEVVFYGQSLDMVVKNKSIVAGDVARFAANKNISFKVCDIALRNHKIDKSELLAGVETVPDGIYEIITKQREGWGYIKAGH
jgi:intracellular sulfur oxidation DsrE/DsrF family protein